MRLDDWPQRLNAYIDSVRRAEARWGEIDCCLYAADAVRAMTGMDPLAAIRGLYSDEQGAVAAIQRYGSNLEKACENFAARFAWKEWESTTYAQRGDLLFYRDSGTIFGGFVAICVGPVGSAFIVSRGLAFIPMSNASRAWSV